MHLTDNMAFLKALVNEDTLLPMMFLGLRKLGNICCGHKLFLNKIRNIFCVPDTKFVSAANVARAGKRGNICVGNNVSSFARALTSHYAKGVVNWERILFLKLINNPSSLKGHCHDKAHMRS